MSSVNESFSAQRIRLPVQGANDWMLANPLVWLLAGVALTVWSWVWTVTFRELASDNRVIVLAAGLLCGGVGLWLRWNDGQAVYLPAWRGPISLFLGCFFLLALIGVTGVFVASFFVDDTHGLKSAPLFLVWLCAAPPTLFAAKRCLGTEIADRSGPIESNRSEAVAHEVSLAFVVVAGLCVIGSFTLYADPSDPTEWDTMRLFLRVCMAVSMYAGALMLVSKGLRRGLLSLLFTLHLMAITTAALSAPPSPGIVQQAWMRLFRPYLEFAYLNNAYHYYAPEPGPSSYVWFRVIFEDPTKKLEEGLWHKIPDIDEAGNIHHPVALDYQRFLSLTESIAQADASPPEWLYNPRTNRFDIRNPFWANRLSLIPGEDDPLGKIRNEKQLRIPLLPGEPLVPYQQQVRVPSEGSRKLLASYARFIGHKFPQHPDKPDWTFKSVKIYQVVHSIVPIQWLRERYPPTDPQLYRPIYVGNYTAQGMMIDDKDPYLYWMLPSWRKVANDPDSEIHDYARQHAGDPKFIRLGGKDNRWVTWEEREK